MQKYKVGYACGAFDLLHVGCLNLLECCKSMCEELIVGVCDDTYVHGIKHMDPMIPAEDRVRMVNAQKVVDDAQLISNWETDDQLVGQRRFRFDVIFFE